MFTSRTIVLADYWKKVLLQDIFRKIENACKRRSTPSQLQCAFLKARCCVYCCVSWKPRL